MSLAVTFADIEAAAGRLAGQVLDTPCVESRTLGQIAGCQVFLKFENLQFTASFKERGALNKLLALVEQGVKGVIVLKIDENSAVDISMSNISLTELAYAAMRLQGHAQRCIDPDSAPPEGQEFRPRDGA